MSAVKIIKFQTYEKIGLAIRSRQMSPNEISFAEDRAIADFRGFHGVASVHSLRVENLTVINTLLEITEKMRNDLLRRKESCTLTAKTV